MTLLDIVKQDKEMRRVFGEQELKIIEKQLLGVELSASEKTRLSRDIRPKFRIIERLSSIRNEFPLRKAQEIKFLINETREIILQSKWGNMVGNITLFGSAVENKLRLDSDIDLSVEFKKIEKKEATEFLLEIQGKISSRIQLSVFNILPANVQKEIIKKGRVIFKKDGIS